MPRIHVCALSRLHAFATETGARDIVTLIKDVTRVETPPGVEAGRHLVINVSDITEAREGEILAGAAHIQRFIDVAEGWDRAAPLLIHCYAGVSRSTAAAFIAACMLRPDRSEAEWAGAIRAASPTATPNLHLVRLADDMLGRGGRMADAIAAIGRGADCFEGVPFALEIGPRTPR